MEFGTNAMPLAIPLDQLYVIPPVPFNVTDDPKQTTVEGEAIIPAIGIGFTVIAATAVFEQPFEVPVTV